MPVTVEVLGQRVLRRLGLALVAGTSRPADAGTTTKARMASQALRRLGVTVVEPAQRAGLSGTRTLVDMASSVLRHLGVSPVPNASAPADFTVFARPEIAARALRIVGVNPATPSVITQTTTADAIALEVLRRLGVVAADETPAVADQTLALNAVYDVHERLLGAGIVTWQSNATPRYIARQYEILAANLLAPSFGKVADPANYAFAMQEARTLALSGGRAQAIAEAKVAEVHGSLVRRGLADWAVDAAPVGLAADLEVLVAAHLAPIYGADVKLDPAAAEERIRMTMMLGARGVTEAQNVLRSVHDALADAGIADWTLDATPHSVAADLVSAAAAQLGPMLGRPEQPDLYAAAFARIRTAVQGRKAQAQAEEEVAAAYSALVAQGLATWAIDQTPAAYGDAIVSLAAAKLAPVYGGTRDPVAYEMALKSARLMILGGPVGVQIAAEKVGDVHANLSARRRTRWLLNDIPRAVEEPYVMMAAVLMAPIAGVRMDNADWAAGERMVIQFNALPSTGATTVGEYF